jgi:hypothetical protein
LRPNDLTVLIEIRHASIDPKALDDAFGLVPECSWKAGEPKTEGDVVGTRRESYWVARMPMPPLPSIPAELVPLETALMWTALMFERRKAFWERLRAEGASAQVSIMAAAESFRLSHDVLTMLAKVGLSVSVEFCHAAEAAGVSRGQG